MKKYILITVSIIINFSAHLFAQGSIGWTEQQIRNEYSENPNASISTDYVSGFKSVVVVDASVTASFAINPSTGWCVASVMQFRDNSIYTSLINKFNRTYTVVNIHKQWETTLRGHKIDIQAYYSEKLKSNMIKCKEV